MFIDISSLSNLGELNGTNIDAETEQDSEQEPETLVNITSDKEDPKQTEEIKQFYSLAISASRLKELSRLDLSKSQTIYEVTGWLNAEELKHLDGFSGTIEFKIQKSVNLTILNEIDLSKATVVLDPYINTRELIRQPMQRMLINSVTALEYIVENNLGATMQAEEIILSHYKSDKVIPMFLRQKKYQDFVRKFNVQVETY
jgi:hypothetical protein